MGSNRVRRAGCSIRFVLVVLLTGAACLGVALAVSAFPRLLVTLLGLEGLGPLSRALPAESPGLALTGEPLDHVYLKLSPQATVPVELAPAIVSSGYVSPPPLIGDTSIPGRTRYLLTIDEDQVNELVHKLPLSEGSSRHRYRDVNVDLVPGGLVLYADIDLGIRWQRIGLLLLAGEGTPTLSPSGLVLEGEVYAMPAPGSLGRLLLPNGRQAQRALYGLRIAGPLPGEARVDTARFYDERLQILAEATYTAETPPDTGWQPLEEGVELREIDVPTGAGSRAERLSIVRLDPANLRLRVRYDPINPKTISKWADKLDPLMVVNGGYFASEGESGSEIIGLLVSDGQRWGTPLDDFAGMLAVNAAGEVSVRSLRDRPYDPQEPLAQALQSFPLLVKPGGVMGFPAAADDGTPARRTVVAQDHVGNLVFVVAPHGALSLHDLAVFLADSDLTMEVALNLDGGGSTGMWLATPSVRVEIDSLTPVPSVIVVERR